MNSTREHILNTAVSLFLLKSYHEVTMSDIVSASGMSKGAFYHHFVSKENVFEEVVNYFYIGSFQHDLDQLSWDSLQTFCQAYARMITERNKRFNDKAEGAAELIRANQLTIIADATKMFPRFRETQRARQQEELNAWTSVIASARQAGEIKAELTDNQIARLFMFINYGVGINQLLRVQSTELTTEISQNFEALYSVIKT